jgi:spore germination protein YaaH
MRQQYVDQMALPPMDTTDPLCVTVVVARCKYCVNKGDTLMSVNKRFRLNTNWMQLWNLNGADDHDPATTAITDPDAIQGKAYDDDLDLHQNIINVGPVYTSQAGDSLINVAARFHTTVKSIIDVNPDVSESNDILPGQDLCLMTCTDNYGEYGPNTHSYVPNYAY